MYLAEARERGIPLLPPDINESQLNFSVEPGKGVRFGLTAIKGLGEGAINALIEARTALGGAVPSLHALCEILDMRIANKRVFEALVKSGACDSMASAANRARLFAQIDSACEHGSRTQRDKDLGQTDLFGGGPEHNPADLPLPNVPLWNDLEQLQYEKETLGLYWTGHPMDRYADDLRLYGAKSTADLAVKKDVVEEIVVVAAPQAPSDNGGGANWRDKRGGEEVSIGGIVSGLRPLKTRKGDRMCVFMLDDAAGSVEIVVFPEAFKQFGHLGENGQMVIVKGKFEKDDETARVLASEIAPIDMVRERLAKSVAIRMSVPPHGRDTFVKLWDVLMQHKGDRRVAIELQEPDLKLRIRLDINAQIKVRPSERLVAEVEKICGAGSVSLR